MEKSLKTTYKYQHSSGWQILLLDGLFLVLLTAIVANAFETTTLKPVNGVLRKVAYDGNVTILCKTSNRSNTFFYDVAKKEKIKPFIFENDLLDQYAVLILHRIRQPSTYQCWENNTLLSETILEIDSSSQLVGIETGIGDNAALTCIYNANEKIYLQKYMRRNVNDIDIMERILADIISIDSTTSKLFIKNASEQKSIFNCTYSNYNKYIGGSKLNGGTPPLPVENFKCRGDNYYSMICKFPIPQNNILTEYNLTYFSAFPKDVRKCKVILDGNYGTIILSRSSDGSKCHYAPSSNNYTFNLISKNVLGISKQRFLVNNHENVIPPKIEIELNHITSNSVNLCWTDIQNPYYESFIIIIYNIHIQPINLDGYSITSSCISLKCNMTLNLMYANWNYTVTITARVNATKSEWNTPSNVSFATRARAPDRAPKTIAGGFYIRYNLDNNEISLYWEEMAAHEKNGPAFHYSIKEYDMNGKLLNSKTTKDTTATFPWLEKTRIYKVQAVNAFGESHDASEIRADKPRSVYAPQEIEQLHNGTYILTWQHPDDYQQQPPSNYTVFWCETVLKECEGVLHFKVVNSSETEFQIETGNRKLSMAVAANYPNWSTGLHWKTCSGDLGGELEKIIPEAVAKSATNILFTWRLEKTCTKVVKGYNITYCVVQTEYQPLCDSEYYTQTINNSGIQNYNLTDLKPYSLYRITILMFSDTKRSPSTSIHCRTKDAAPYPATSVSFDKTSLTTKSVNISWLAPKITNGIIKKYTIWLRIRNFITNKDIPLLNLTRHSDNRISYKLTNLTSYSTYDIWITTWTSQESKKSETLQITTLIGRPSSPKNVELTKEGNYYILSWADPKIPSGRVELYELTLFDGNETKMGFVQRGSKSKHKCRLKYPGCPEKMQKMEVRAINLVPEQELDITIFDNNTLAKEGNIIDTVTNYYNWNKDFECELMDEDTVKLPIISGITYFTIKSLPGSSNSFDCEPFPWEVLMASLLIIGMLVATIVWSYNFIHRQLGVGVKFPDPITDLMNINTKLPDIHSTEKHKNDLNEKTNVSDYLIKLKEKVFLINFGSALTNSSAGNDVDDIDRADSVIRSNSRDDIEEYFNQQVPQDDKVSSKSTTSLNDNSLSYHQHSPLQSNIEQVKSIIKDDGYIAIDELVASKSITNDDNSSSSDTLYMAMHSSASSLKKECSNTIVTDNMNESYVNNIPINQLKTKTSPTKITVFSNYLPNTFLTTKSTPAQCNIISNLGMTLDNYVVPDSLPKIAASQHTIPLNEENGSAQQQVQQQSKPLVSYGYVTSDFWSQPNAMK